MNTKTFPLRVVLTVVTGRLLTEPRGPRDNGIGDLYGLLNWITSDNLFTHQLPRAEGVAAPYVLRRFPELAGANDLLPELDEALNTNESDSEQVISKWNLLDQIPAGLWARVRAKAKQEGVSLRALILRLLTEWLED